MDQTSGAYRSTSSYQARSSDPAARATRATTDGSSRMGDSRGAGAAFGSALTISEGGTMPPDTPILGYLAGHRNAPSGCSRPGDAAPAVASWLRPRSAGHKHKEAVLSLLECHNDRVRSLGG